MLKLTLATLLAVGCAFSAGPAAAQNNSNTRDQIRMIEQEYARQSNGAMISDAQLEFYIDRSNQGWTRNQISQDIANSRRQYANSQWRPQSGYVARELICSSVDNRYRECQAPFRGTAVVTQQISDANCVKGQSWGERPGVIWVNRGCRARFGILPDRNDRNDRNGNYGNNRMIVCASNQNRYRECRTNITGRVQLAARLKNSAACGAEGRNWGQRPGIVWVRNGCRAQFSSVGRPGPRDDNRQERRDDRQQVVLDNNYNVSCSSNNNNRVNCSWDARYGQPRVTRQLSQNACIEGRSWGYDNRNTLWVSNGCRANFTSTRTNR